MNPLFIDPEVQEESDSYGFEAQTSDNRYYFYCDILASIIAQLLTSRSFPDLCGLLHNHGSFPELVDPVIGPYTRSVNPAKLWLCRTLSCRGTHQSQRPSGLGPFRLEAGRTDRIDSGMSADGHTNISH